jgi:hypothetical protein
MGISGRVVSANLVSFTVSIAKSDGTYIDSIRTKDKVKQKNLFII